MNVGAKETILIIQDLSSLKVTVNLPETMPIMAKPGLTLEERTIRTNPTVYLTALSDRGFPARIVEMSSMADFATRTYEGTLEFDPPEDLNILPGMTAKLEVNLSDAEEVKKGSYVVPSQAVIADESGNAFVWVVDSTSNKVSKQSVKTGSLRGSEIEVISDALSDGDWVATSGVHQLREGNQVRKFEN